MQWGGQKLLKPDFLQEKTLMKLCSKRSVNLLVFLGCQYVIYVPFVAV